MIPRFFKSKKGFTLIELLVVIAIIGVLASIVLASLNTARRKGRDVRRMADLGQVRLALELFFDTGANRSYPSQAGTAWTALQTTLQGAISCGNAPCMVRVPDDPTPATPYLYASLDAAGVACTVACPSYVMRAVLEDTGNQALLTDIDGSFTNTSVINCDDTTAIPVAGGYCQRP
ncbi:MAG TPA: type II secretion system protein [Candidatus Paceibacterota bacterium]